VLVEEEHLPPLDQLLLKHENVEDFFIFCECFLSKVVGVGAWRELCTKQKISDFATVSDEAFAYLLVENGAAVDELFKAHCIATLVTPKKPKQISIPPFTSYNDDMSDLL